MGWVNFANTKPDSFNAVKLTALLGVPSVSATLFVNPSDIFVAQIALTAVAFLNAGEAVAYISGITLQDGTPIQFSGQPADMEFAWTESVITFVLTQLYHAGSEALATANTYTVL